MKLFRSLYDWVLSWSTRPGARRALGGLAFAESSFFPIPPDPLLLGMGLGAPKRALHFAMICTIGSVAGGLFGYFLGAAFQDPITTVLQWIFGLMGNSASFLGTVASGVAIDTATGHAALFGSHPVYQDGLLWKVTTLYQDNAFMAVLGAALTPIPYKVFTVAGGYCSINIPGFIAASLLGRGARFFAVAAVVRLCGDRAKALIDKYFNTVISAFFLLLVGGFIVAKWAMS